jgi:NAD(P)-dependent dehydrogenase (short-subunit alcohol dehydrogenase family)
VKLKPIEEQVVVVFGASSGIGREGGEAVARTAEVADYEQVVAVANLAVEAFGRIDTRVHAAGVILYAPFEETEVEEFRRVLDVNLLGQIRLLSVGWRSRGPTLA